MNIKNNWELQINLQNLMINCDGWFNRMEVGAKFQWRTNFHDEDLSTWPSLIGNHLLTKVEEKNTETRIFAITTLSEHFYQTYCSFLSTLLSLDWQHRWHLSMTKTYKSSCHAYDKSFNNDGNCVEKNCTSLCNQLFFLITISFCVIA